jgi:predicted nucleic acid-binding protein
VRIFLDANILVAVLCNEYPQFSFCSKVLSLCDDKRYMVYTSPLCLAIAYYFAEKKNGSKLAKQKIHLLCSKINITTMNADVVNKATTNKAIEDFEDGMEYYSAIESKCKCIVTNDKDDFYFSKIEILNAHDFLIKHAVKKRN